MCMIDIVRLCLTSRRVMLETSIKTSITQPCVICLIAGTVVGERPRATKTHRKMGVPLRITYGCASVAFEVSEKVENQLCVRADVSKVRYSAACIILR